MAGIARAVKMPWVKIDDGVPHHGKLFAGGACLRGMFTDGLCYCARNLTDGFIPANALALLSPGTPHRLAMRLIGELVRVGSWAITDGGWEIHDYLRYQPSRQEVLGARAAAKARKDAWNARKNAERTATEQRSERVPNAERTAVEHPPRTPSPSPSRTRTESSRRRREAGTLQPGFERFWARYPNKVGKQAALDRWQKDRLEPKADEIMAGLDRNMAYLTREGGKYEPNPETWLHEGRWQDEPRALLPLAPKTQGNADAVRAFAEQHRA